MPLSDIKRQKLLYKDEHDLQAKSYKLFLYEFPKLRGRLFAIPNGGYRHYLTAKKLKREGVVSGVWDMFLSIPNKSKSGLFIEFKYGYNRLTDNQKLFRQLHEKDYEFAIAKFDVDLIEAIKLYLRN